MNGFSMKFEILLTRLAMAVSSLAVTLGLADIIYGVIASADGASIKKITLLSLFSLAILSLFYGNIVYQLTRIGQLKRNRDNAGYSELEGLHCADRAPSVAILIPSYKEQLPVVMQTVVSAALAEYPERRITLLIDDPPACSGADHLALCATRELAVELNEFFRNAAERFGVAWFSYDKRLRSGALVLKREQETLASLYDEAALVVEAIGRRYAELSDPAFAHADELFAREIIDRLVREHRARAAGLRNSLGISEAMVDREYRRLRNLFAVPISSFERKRFDNLSHAPNKAMNLNSYIGLIGRAFLISGSAGGAPALTESASPDADLVLAAADYILTVDADSIILPDYLLKLVSIMEADRGVAIAQTPYSAFPNARSLLERVAGATTDIQYLVHQGFTAYNATFWVGANAVLRCAALHEIKTEVEERGHLIPVFIQDKTQIEDTGSTIDLVARGWRLHNHPERLAFSATPPDFGALVIQRRRWANGGLIIFKDLLDLWSRGQSPRAGKLEAVIRSHYLVSPALANIGLLLLLVIPFGSEYSNAWFPIAAAPYYVLYGRDLNRSGYAWRDLFRVYSLTLLLVPVNLAGVYRSIEQIVTGRKTPFARTPKIGGRTSAPAGHLLVLWALTAIAFLSAGVNLWFGNVLFFCFSAMNTGFFIYGVLYLIGLPTAVADLKLSLSSSLAERNAGARLTSALAEQPYL
jgi:cellulose synthase/poly-beta-1,6-N-acetylglucosamine synthase-like glycosyltransferase